MKRNTKQSPPAAIILAAGRSSRFGANKLFYPIDGIPMYLRIINVLVALQKKGQIGPLFVVTGSDEIAGTLSAVRQTAAEPSETGSAERSDTRNSLSDPITAAKTPETGSITVVRNPEPELGISHSIHLGISALLAENPVTPACLFAVADQPFLTESSISSLLARFADSGRGMAACSCRDRIGNPVVFSAQYFPELLSLTGDRGGKKVLLRHREDVALCEIPLSELRDFDTLPFSKAGSFLLPGETKTQTAEDLFPFLLQDRCVISIVGAGGKTSLMYQLAECLVHRGRRTLVTTTTHIMKPGAEHLALTPDEVRSLWKRGSFAVLGAKDPFSRGQKLRMPDASLLRTCMAEAEFTLIEADGAKRMPAKIPGKSEPVLLEETDIVIGVLGLSAIGKPLKEVCFRSGLFETEAALRSMLTEGAVSPETVLTPELSARVLASDAGTRKGVGCRPYIVVLNQCDTALRLRDAEEISEHLRRIAPPGQISMICFSRLQVSS